MLYRLKYNIKFIFNSIRKDKNGLWKIILPFKHIVANNKSHIFLYIENDIEIKNCIIVLAESDTFIKVNLFTLEECIELEE